MLPPKPSVLLVRYRAALARNAARVLALLLSLAVVPEAFAQIRVTAAWNPNTDSLTAGYRVFVGTAPGSPGTSIDVGMATSAVLTLPPGNLYFVAVRGYTAAGVLGPPSVEAQVDLSAPPGTPEGFNASVNGPRTVLDWSDPTTGGLPLTYVLSVGTAAGAANLMNGVSVGAVRSVAGDLPPGIYYARIQAANPIGIGPPADVAFQVGGGYRPASPTALAAAISGSDVRLTWSAPAAGSAADAATSYVLEAGTIPGASNLVSVNIGNITSFAAAVPPGTYYVRVRAVNARGISDPSNEVVMQVGAPSREIGPPRNLRAVLSGSTLTLTWDAPAGGGATSYVLEAGTHPGATNVVAANVGGTTTITVPMPIGSYHIRVRAAGPSGLSDDTSNEVIVKRY